MARHDRLLTLLLVLGGVSVALLLSASAAAGQEPEPECDPAVVPGPTLGRAGMHTPAQHECAFHERLNANFEALDAAVCADQLACYAQARSRTYARLSTPPPANGEIRYCSDCAHTKPCAPGGTGAVALREAGLWNCEGW